MTAASRHTGGLIKKLLVLCLDTHIFISFLAMCALPLAGQGRLAFTPIDANSGLSENKVRNITQLPDGRMVITTEGLTNIYDGTAFKYLHADADRVYPLANYTGFHRVYVDGTGHLWVKNYGKLMFVDMKQERVVANTDSVVALLGMQGPLSDFFMDSAHGYWFLTESNRLWYRGAGDGQSRVFLDDIGTIHPPADRLYDVAVMGAQVFLFFRSGLMVCLDLATRKELYRQNAPCTDLNGAYDRTLLVVPNGRYLYQIRNGTGGRMVRFDVDKREWETLLETGYWLNTLSVDEKGSVWVSCKTGLWYLGNNTAEKQFMPTLHLVDGRTVNTEISTLCHDRQGGMWVGTLNRGLLYYHPERFKFKNFGKSLFGIDEGNELRVTCMAETNGDVLVGTQRGLYRYGRGSSKPVLFTGSLAGTSCLSLVTDRAGRVWLGTDNAGLYCIEGNGAKHFTDGIQTVYGLLERPNGTFTLCTDKGMGTFEPSTGRFVANETLSQRGIRRVFQLVGLGNDGLLGLSNAGPFVYWPETDSVYVPAATGGEKDAMFRHSNQNYNCLFADSRGLVWFGTQDGLNMWDGGAKRTYRFYTADGLVNNNVQSIAEDGNGSLWVSTANGISRITVEQGKDGWRFIFANFNRYDGVIENEFLQRSVCSTGDGRMLWGGIDGFNELAVTSVDGAQRPVGRPLFTKLLLFGNEVKPGERYNGRIILPQAVNSVNALTLEHDQNFIGIEFSAMNYINPTQTHYRYMLEGVDAAWREARTTDGPGRAVYTDLQPGRYTFKVCAAGNGRYQGNDIAVMEITVKRPFWATPVAYFVYLLVLALLFYATLRFYLNQKQQQLQLQQKEALDAMKYSFFTNVSHELRTPLTLILTPLQTLLGKMEDGQLKQQLDGIRRNADHLLVLVNQLLDFRRMESGESLWPGYCDVADFVRTVCAPFVELSHSRGVGFEVDCRQPQLFANIDKDKVRKALDNLLSNAFKFTGQGGCITVVVDRALMMPDEVDALSISVADTGCGIDAKELPRVFERFYQADNQGNRTVGSGIGLHMANEYVKMHNGTLTATSELGKGSVFTMVVPTNLQPIDQAGAATAQRKGDGAVTVLVAEDNDEFRAFMCGQLAEHYNVLNARNGRDALEMILERQPDLVVSDVMMPGMSGVELCDRLKRDVRISHIPVVLLTARSSAEAEMEGYRAGADAFVPKPFNMEMLLLRIGNLLERQEERRRLFKKAIVIQPENLTTTNVDETFVKKVLLCIEKHMNDTTFSVEQMGKEMNMERTGLYRKLVAITGQTPTVFIRSVRLKRAACLLEQGHAVAEVVDLVGFGTNSYFSKCFQEEYGVKPSHYADKHRG